MVLDLKKKNGTHRINFGMLIKIRMLGSHLKPAKLKYMKARFKYLHFY